MKTRYECRVAGGRCRVLSAGMRGIVLTSMLLLAVSVWAQQDMDMEITGFRVPEYDAQGVMTSQLFGERAEVQGGGEVKITTLRVEFYKEGKTVVTVNSPYCFYNQKTREAHSDAPVSAEMDRLTMTGRGYLLESGQNTVKVFDDSRVVVKDAAKQMSGVPAVTGGTNAETVITSKELFLDYKARTAQFEKNVHVQDPKMEMFCDTLKIKFGENNQIDWIGASTEVRILHEGKEALAGKATYSVQTDEFLLEDNPRILDGKNMLMGEQIRFWRGSGRMVCEPSARIVVYSDKKFKTDLFEK
ncbi:MAG: LptA/OstA family protein [Kiritimatiellales bacterium]|nr:LptA/OstA family protein [Kiritimatiellales bacterium]